MTRDVEGKTLFIPIAEAKTVPTFLLIHKLVGGVELKIRRLVFIYNANISDIHFRWR